MMDSYDRAILRVLQSEGRISNRDLAERIHLSPTPCWRRVRDLEQRGVIRGYRARLDPEALGLEFLVLAHVTLESHHADIVEAFDTAIRSLPEVLECHMVSGDHDYALKIVARDLDAYTRLLRERLLVLPGVHRISSNFVMRPVKNADELPVYDD